MRREWFKQRCNLGNFLLPLWIDLLWLCCTHHDRHLGLLQRTQTFPMVRHSLVFGQRVFQNSELALETQQPERLGSSHHYHCVSRSTFGSRDDNAIWIQKVNETQTQAFVLISSTSNTPDFIKLWCKKFGVNTVKTTGCSWEDNSCDSPKIHQKETMTPQIKHIMGLLFQTNLNAEMVCVFTKIIQSWLFEVAADGPIGSGRTKCRQAATHLRLP